MDSSRRERDDLRPGDRWGEINLNGLADGSYPDADVQVHSASFGIVFSGLGGPDFLSGRGTGANGSKHDTYSMTFYDGPGGDEVRGGDGFNSIYPPATPDLGDLYLGGPGFDILDFTINSRTADQTISQDGISNDGATNENDNVGPTSTGSTPGPGATRSSGVRVARSSMRDPGTTTSRVDRGTT